MSNKGKACGEVTNAEYILVDVHHQTWHFLLFGGFIFEPTGHWKSLANSSMLLKVAITLTLPGLCEPVNILSLKD